MTCQTLQYSIFSVYISYAYEFYVNSTFVYSIQNSHKMNTNSKIIYKVHEFEKLIDITLKNTI